ncbi:MAG: hypothetical protein HY832_02625 [Candidatus Aenigmarchaeota archaeon]|nr:hypothetical protein [Candidatus Aenigmarchaeota archaeon]
MEKNIISAAIIVLLLGTVGVIGVQLYGSKVTGYVTSPDPNQGFSSYDEMMAAHHGSGASGDACGFVGESNVTVMDGEELPYGITFDTNGYEKLLSFDSSISMSGVQQTVVGLDIELPCCDFKLIEPAGNCDCGHHVALVGLAKMLATKGYSKTDIQAEIVKWKGLFYPNGTASAAGGC